MKNLHSTITLIDMGECPHTIDMAQDLHYGLDMRRNLVIAANQTASSSWEGKLKRMSLLWTTCIWTVSDKLTFNSYLLHFCLNRA